VNIARGQRRTIHSGTVRAYDEAAGLGEIEADEGARYSFHSTAITDGTRTIAVGRSVHFVLVFAPRGCIEADEVTPR
jgi:cold shock CspA family protein